jgi:hypothetical protein
MFYQYKKSLISIIIAFIFFIVGIWEFYILSIYNNNELSAYIYTIIKSIFNILLSVFIFYNISNKILNFIILLIIVVTNLWVLYLFCNLDHYKVFVKVIIVEFIILNIQSNILVITIILKMLTWMIKPNTETAIINDASSEIIDIPYAAPNILDVSNDKYLPQAIQLKIDK